MKFSIILPVYNVAPYITKCLESIQRQTLKDFECLIIDDGSQDDSIAIAVKLIGEDERFKIHHKTNGGLSDARNYGMQFAEGEYLLFVDSDDYIAPELLEKTYAKAKEHDSDIVCFALMYLYPDNREAYSSGGDFEVTDYHLNPELIFINNSANNKIYRRTFMEDKRFIKGMWYEDMAVIPVWLTKANNVSCVKEALYYYVQRPNSISHSADIRVFDIYKALNILKKELHLTSEDISKLYLDNGLEMTTLRIREIADEKVRKAYYAQNVTYLNAEYPTWYKAVKKRNYPLKKKIVFCLLKSQHFNLLDKLYHL